MENSPVIHNNKLSIETLSRALECGTLDEICAEIKKLREQGFFNETVIEQFIKERLPHQIIFYGAPGTGKSFIVDVLTHNFNVERTTFHPESDYSSFVGCYKPVSVCKGGISTIEYNFVAQSFIRAYINAVKYPDKLQFLIVEEINRGNCAAIFGDLFQLLDRNAEGESSYSINCDTDIASYLKKEFKEDKTVDVSKLTLPSNLYIWATMNTSDQSLFPMDSAFKRRWDMEYVGISDAGKGWLIETKKGEYKSWFSFLKWINSVILEKTQSQDKQLGYFFIRPANGTTVISRRNFINKVIFYLWNDVFRDYMKSDTPFDLSSDRGSFELNALKAALGGKDPYTIKAFDEFIKNVNTLPDFLWNLEDPTYTPSPSTPTILSIYGITERVGTPPTTVPSDFKVMLYKTSDPTPYYLIKRDNKVLVTLYYITCRNLTASQAIATWKKAGAEKHITTEPSKIKKAFEVKDKNGDQIYINYDTSKGHSSWEKVVKIAGELGVTIIS